MEQVFARQFVERFGDQFVLISPDEAERLGLFGPEPLAPVTRERIGTAIGISSEPRRILIEPCGKCGEQIGSHGGLLPEEMLVPLVIA